MSSRRPLASAVLAVLAACGSGGSSHGGEGIPLPVGTWRTPCVNDDDGTSSIHQLVVGATTYASANALFTNATDCTGDSTRSSERGTVSNAGTVTANLGETPVTALKIDATGGGTGAQTAYLLVYVDTTANPNRMYQGLRDEGHDGLTPATRPVALDDSGYFLKVNSELNPLPAAYQGTWRSRCVNDGERSSFIEQLVIGATTFTWARIEYGPAIDCTGGSSSGWATGSLNDAGTVAADFGGPSVTALMVDVTTTGELTDYMLLYVDTTVNPNRLHFGVYDAARNGSMPATRPVAVDVSDYLVKQ